MGDANLKKKRLDICFFVIYYEYVNNGSCERKGVIVMKKKFKMQDLDCAHCAAKMEEGIKKINGVKDASISFMTQKMTIEAEEERFDEIMEEVKAVCAKIEPDCKILM